MRKRSALNQAEVESIWKTRGFSCSLWIDRPGQVWKDFVHDADELFMVLDGEMELELHGRTIHPKPGEEMIIPAKTVHTVRNVGHTTAHWLCGYKS